ncbi:MAG: ATP-binding cassette domain-containing protein [Gemmatimonadetes bacterium]|nr:ATP-binding cassette domain-containing protein [Gemmatimonadota bacterium]
MISFKQVSKSYGKTPAVRDLTFEIRRGEFLFLMGASGAGKSTILRLLHHSIRPTSGVVTVGEFSSDTIKERQIPHLRRKLGFVLQDFRLIADRSVSENVAIAMRITGESRRKIEARVNEVLGQVGLIGRAREKAGNLSGGEMQRVAIARALVNRPLALIADEPTGNLDPETAQGIYSILDRAHIGGTAVFVATHDRDFVDRAGHKVLHLEHGRIVIPRIAPGTAPRSSKPSSSVSC